MTESFQVEDSTHRKSQTVVEHLRTFFGLGCPEIQVNPPNATNLTAHDRVSLDMQTTELRILSQTLEMGRGHQTKHYPKQSGYWITFRSVCEMCWREITVAVVTL